MKSLAAVAMIVACFGWNAVAQHGATHSGGFSGSHAGSVTRSTPSFHGSFSGPRSFSGPGRIAAPPRYGIHRNPGIGRNPGQFRPGGPNNYSTRQPYSASLRRNPNSFAGRQPSADPMHHHRMPYHSPYDRDHRRNFYVGGGFPFWGYPYLLPSYLDYPGYDSESAYNDAPNQAEAGPYEPSSDQATPGSYPPEPAPAYTPWPYGSPTPGASLSAAVATPPIEAPVTLVFKDGRPAEQVHNYMLTASTLTVLDQHRRDIPIDQIDLSATAKANHDAGVDFSLPGGTR